MMIPSHPVAAVITALMGSTTAVMASLHWFIFSATDTTGGGSLAPWAQVGGSVTAVATLAYVATLFATGRLVAANIDKVIADGAEREKKLIEIALDNHNMAQRMWDRWGGDSRDNRGDNRGR